MAKQGVLVTGGSTGIGRALVRRFARGGHRVWFTYHSNRRPAETLAAELAGEGAEVEAFEFDQGDWDSHVELHDRLPGPVDILVNNAAVGSQTVRRYVDGTPEQCDAAFLQVNSVGPLWLVRSVLPGMLDRGHGKIVNVASVGGGVATFPDFHIADGMSKAALVYLTKHLAAELAHRPVDVFAVCPGAVRTPMLQASLLDGLAGAELDDLIRRLPGERLIQPEEIADLVWWLCRDEASVLRGAVLDASLGLGVHPGLLTGPGAAMGHASSTAARSVA
ncbi:SDR family NAD(P)-dependent oxidoreductase [Kutzneria kofuensis]|uniref:NAD(P)-dependent dehydrogenase (Short-subunit alcohol dehydrogenase family) n=1 Tax=Kutzneria kofuensis TaxID=103725 RepID=A0A7W9KNI2_9PSEU|nr:SDR family oxidoreductase [Kutzneria kofuensis]MBB5895563.1 NAD(P)-dependent dehydrogenase (short-subunit alcohol dehydrogenase family) [Kutzneria kofuensis]